MNPGHEDCPHEFEHLHMWGQQEPFKTMLICRHDHMEPIQADDRIGTGPIVADYCNCCGTMHRRPEYQ